VYHAIQQAVGHVLNLVVGVTALTAFVLFVGILAIELSKRPRYSVRTLLVATTVVAAVLGLAVCAANK
jgi:hypothetical protein